MHQFRQTSRGRVAARTIGMLALASAPATARADIPTPPIPGIDFLTLGVPLGPIIGLGVLALTVTAFVLLRRRKVHGGVAFIVAALLFLLGDYAAYLVGRERALEARDRWDAKWDADLRARASASATATPSGTESARRVAPPCRGRHCP